MKISSNLFQSSTQAITTTCTACGLLCDDVVLTSTDPIAIKNGCSKSLNFFEQAYSANISSPDSPRVSGKITNYETAIKAAAEILSKSKQPLISGLGTEVQGMRATIGLAERIGATLDHMHSEGAIKNILAFQNSGWQNTTLTEIKNRADVILAIGTDIVTSHPRFFERLVWNASSMFNKSLPEVIYLGVSVENSKAGISPEGKMPIVIPAEITEMPEIINALNALMNDKNHLNKKLATDCIGGVSISSLKLILEKLKAAQYAVVVWSAGNFKFSHAELTIQSIIQLITKLNESNRVAGLPLNAGDGDMSVNNTSTWLSSYPTRSRFRSQKLRTLPEYDFYHFSSKQQLKSCDSLLWISTFNTLKPPKSNAPTIVIGHPNIQFDQTPEVFIPVGIPGIDHSGTIFRMDNVVALPLNKIREKNLPSLSQVIQQLLNCCL